MSGGSMNPVRLRLKERSTNATIGIYPKLF